jgi:hypothetical protein
VQAGLESVILRISMPDMALKSPVLRNNRKVAFGPTKSRSSLANPRSSIDRVPSEACSGAEFSKNSLFLLLRLVSQDYLHRHEVIDITREKLKIVKLCRDFRRLAAEIARVGHRESEFGAHCTFNVGHFSERDFASGFLCE